MSLDPKADVYRTNFTTGADNGVTSRPTLKTKRRAASVVKVRTNGKHKIKGASMNVPAGMNRLLRPQARYNWLMPNIGAITPTYIETVLNGALAGNHVQQWALFDLMLRTWPELSACYQELIYGVLRKKLIYEAFHEEDEQPTPDALERTKLVSTALRQMQPDTQQDGNDLSGTIEDILDAWFRGVAVSEIVWNTIDDQQVGTITAPRSTFCVDPVNYAFDYDNSIGLMPKKKNQGGFYPFGNTSANSMLPQVSKLIPFPDNKFLVAVHKAKAGSPLGGALMVPLAWWWCAANFSSDWLLNYAQLFGLPIRWANYPVNAPQATIDAVCNLLQNMGSNPWWAGPEGTLLNVLPAAAGSDHTPQGELLDRADRYCRNLILGQTMTGSHGTTGKGGGQAFGEVEATVKDDRIDAAGKFAASVINTQLIPSILMLNYGDKDECPTIKFLEDEVADFTEAQRDQVLVNAGLPVGVDYMRKKYDIPAPAKGEETLSKPEPMSQFGNDPGSYSDTNPFKQQNTDNTNLPNEDVKASDQTGHPFRGNQYVKLGDNVRTPDGSGMVVGHDPDGEWVSVRGIVKKYKTHQLSKLSPFPSLLESEENKRRLMRNAGLQTKLEQLNEIPDDAVYSRELLQLVSEVKSGGEIEGHPFRGNQYTGGIHGEQMAKLLKDAGIAFKNVDVYGSQIVVDLHSEEQARKTADFLGKAFKVRGVLKTIDDAKVNTNTVLLPSKVNIWRVFATTKK